MDLWVTPPLGSLSLSDSCWESTSELARLGYSALQASSLSEVDASALPYSELVVQPSGQHRPDFEGKEPCLDTCSGRGTQ